MSADGQVTSDLVVRDPREVRGGPYNGLTHWVVWQGKGCESVALGAIVQLPDRKFRVVRGTWDGPEFTYWSHAYLWFNELSV